MHYDHHSHGHPHSPAWVDERRADCCDDQLPNISRVGRGPKGDTTDIEIVEGDDGQVTLRLVKRDGQTGETLDQRMTPNISGGHLTLDPVINEKSGYMRLRFVYERPGIDDAATGSWAWISPEIPYRKAGPVGGFYKPGGPEKEGISWEQYLKGVE